MPILHGSPFMSIAQHVPPNITHECLRKRTFIVAVTGKQRRIKFNLAINYTIKVLWAMS
jgi:hypothetical protein